MADFVTSSTSNYAVSTPVQQKKSVTSSGDNAPVRAKNTPVQSASPEFVAVLLPAKQSLTKTMVLVLK